MPGTVIAKHMNLGYAGRISRDADVIVDNRTVKAETADIPFGAPVVLNSDNTYQFFGADGTAAAFAGIAVAEPKQSTDYYNNIVVYKANQRCDVLTRGSATVICTNGTPVAGGAVYVTIAEDVDLPGVKIGDFVAEAHSYLDGEETVDCTVEITNAKWTTGYLDANNVAEVTLLTRVNP